MKKLIKIIKRLHYRFFQLYYALTDKLKEKDVEFAKQNLSEKEFEIFSKLPKYEQKHSVKVAYYVKKRAPSSGGDNRHCRIRLKETIEAALLHDIGKNKIKTNPIEKGIFVVLNFVVPNLFKKIVRIGRDAHDVGNGRDRSLHRGFFKKAYIYKMHAEIGADILERIGSDSFVVELVKEHTKPIVKTDSEELKMLKRADSN